MATIKCSAQNCRTRFRGYKGQKSGFCLACKRERRRLNMIHNPERTMTAEEELIDQEARLTCRVMFPR